MRYPSNLISCAQPLPLGAISCKVARDGGTKSGRRAPCGRRSLSSLLLALLLPVLFDALRSRGLRARCCDFWCALRRGPKAWPFVAPASTFSFTLLFECQTRLRPLPSAISDIERPLTTDSGSSSRISGSLALRASSSLDLIRSHGSFFSPALPSMRTRCQRPCSFLPSRLKSTYPFFLPPYGPPSAYPCPQS